MDARGEQGTVFKVQNQFDNDTEKCSKRIEKAQ